MSTVHAVTPEQLDQLRESGRAAHAAGLPAAPALSDVFMTVVADFGVGDARTRQAAAAFQQGYAEAIDAECRAAGII